MKYWKKKSNIIKSEWNLNMETYHSLMLNLLEVVVLKYLGDIMLLIIIIKTKVECKI